MMIFLDADDTLGDFREHAVSRGVPRWDGIWYTTDPKTWTDEQHFIQAETNRQMEMDDFWIDMPLIPGALELVAAAALRGPTKILTALPRGVRPELWPRVKADKIQWASEKLHVPVKDVIVCQRAEKVQFAKSPVLGSVAAMQRNLLVDDAHQNCAEWTDAGGCAILYQNMPDAIALLKATLEP